MAWLVQSLVASLVLAGFLCCKLGWAGSVVWLALCGVAVMLVHGATRNEGCDGGTCLLPYVFFLLPGWLGLWLVVFLCRKAIRKATVRK